MKIFSTDTGIFVAAGAKTYYNYTNDFSGLANGTYTLLSRIVSNYPSQNTTLQNQTNNPINATTTITVNVPAAPTPDDEEDDGGGGGGGGGGVPQLTYKARYSAFIEPIELKPDDTAKLYINISNTKSKPLNTSVKIFVIKNYKIINEIEKNIITPSKKDIIETVELLKAKCTSEKGEYKVKVEFYESNSKKKTEDVSFKVLPCQQVVAEIEVGKKVYYPDEDANVKFKLINSGNIDLKGIIEITIKNNTWEETFTNITDVRLGKNTTYEGEITNTLAIYSPDIYTLHLRYYDDEILAEAETILLISQVAATTVNIIVWLIILAMLILSILAIIELFKGGKELVKVYKDQNQT